MPGHRGVPSTGETFLLRLNAYLCGMGFWRQFAEYLYLKKRDPEAPRNSYTRMMHGMNRISIFVFLFVMLVLLFRLVRGLFH